jgi:hypothetical protein
MKTQTKIIVIASVILILILGIRSCAKKEAAVASKTNEKVKTTVQIQPPLPGIDVPIQKFEINPSQSNILVSKGGAKINIPANAFLDKDGKIVESKVTVSFREFYNPLDFYLAGIPMNYTENGIEKAFESGGMVEINASTNNTQVFVNKENKIKVDVLSWTKSKDFNLYDLDSETGVWMDKGKDKIEVVSKTDALDSYSKIPSPPKVATVAAFKIKDDTRLFPEIEDYNNILFEPVNVATCKISNAQEMIVRPLKNGIYEVVSILKLGSFRKENKCECYLAFEEGKDYNAALKLYRIKYDKLLKQRDLLKKPWTDYYALVTEYRKNDIKKLNGAEKIIRTLEINEFGFVNCDYPTSYPTGGTVIPSYIDENGARVTLPNVVLVDKGSNALFRYTKNVTYNPNSKNVLWGLTKENKLVYFKEADFAQLPKTNTKQKITMHVYEGELKSYSDIMKVLF